MRNDPSRPAAAIDLGSNSFRLLIAETGGGLPRPLLHRLITVGLGKGLGCGGTLSAASMQRASDALRTFRQELDRYAPGRLRACGTEALRQAVNSHGFLAEAESILGCPVEILSGTEEARLTFAAINASLDLSAPFLVADVGGCSTELIFARDRGLQPDCCSFPFGALNLTDRFAGVEKGDREMTRALRQLVKSSLSERRPACFDNIAGLSLVGSGGTITALAALLQGLTIYDRSKIHGCSIGVEQLDRAFDRLVRLPLAERGKLFGLEGDRGRIIVAGLVIFQTLAERCKVDTLLVSDAGLLEGILLSALAADGTLAR